MQQAVQYIIDDAISTCENDTTPSDEAAEEVRLNLLRAELQDRQRRLAQILAKEAKKLNKAETRKRLNEQALERKKVKNRSKNKVARASRKANRK